MEGAAPTSALILLAFGGGFLFAYFWRYTWFVSRRAQGQLLFFIAVCMAVPLILLSRLFFLGTQYVLPESWVSGVSGFWEALAGPIYAPALDTFIGAYVLGLLAALFLNRTFTRLQDTAEDVIARFGSDLERFLYEAMTEILLVSVTLKSQKVYVGWPVNVGVPNPYRESAKNYMRLLPALSGYRDDNTQELQFTTQYFEVYRQIAREDLPGASADDFQITIPIDEIVTVNLFSTDVDQDVFNIPSKQTVEAQPPPRQTGGSGLCAILLGLLIGWFLGRGSSSS